MESKEIVMLCEKIKKGEVKTLGEDYFFEFKFDGERALILIENHKVSKIINRRGFNIINQFPEFKDSSFEFENGILDSEIIVINNGKTYGDFNEGLSLRTHLKDERKIKERVKKLRAKIMAFDILELNNENLKMKPLTKRKDILVQNIKDNDLIEVVKYYNNFDELWAIVEKEHLEGLIAKHKWVAYENVRSKYWLKIKNWKEEIIEFDGFENAKSEGNPFYKGIILTNREGVRCSCLGGRSEEVEKIIRREGKVKVNCQFLEKTKEGKSRFISFKEVVKE